MHTHTLCSLAIDLSIFQLQFRIILCTVLLYCPKFSRDVNFANHLKVESQAKPKLINRIFQIQIHS
jgi:hypothetical protein